MCIYHFSVLCRYSIIRCRAVIRAKLLTHLLKAWLSGWAIPTRYRFIQVSYHDSTGWQAAVHLFQYFLQKCFYWLDHVFNYNLDFTWFCLKGRIYNKPVLVHAMVWQREVFWTNDNRVHWCFFQVTQCALCTLPLTYPGPLFTKHIGVLPYDCVKSRIYEIRV